MPILVPQSAVDAAVSAWKKQEGILDEMPKDGITIAALMTGRNCSWHTAKRWLKAHAILLGKIKIGRNWNLVYKLKKGK
jgi:hypothetical protein